MSALPPTKNPALIVDDFILYATSHLASVTGIVNTISLYPPIGTPGPGIIQWSGYQVAPAAPKPVSPEQELYNQIDWSKTDLKKDDPEVQEIINPNIADIETKAMEYSQQQNSNPTAYKDSYSGDETLNAASQVNNVKAEKLNQILVEQGIVKQPPAETIKSGYKNLDELLQKAGQWARTLGKNPRVKYENLKINYVQGIHGLCPQGTQSVVVALTGIKGLGLLTGNADWFSFKNPSTGGGRSSFAVPIGGKVYYNDKVKINIPKNSNGTPNFSNSYFGDPSQWQVGDIIVMGYTDGKPYGHIQCWTGWKWVSDFSQNQLQKNHVDTDSIALWRLNQNGKAAVESQKSA